MAARRSEQSAAAARSRRLYQARRKRGHSAGESLVLSEVVLVPSWVEVQKAARR